MTRISVVFSVISSLCFILLIPILLFSQEKITVRLMDSNGLPFGVERFGGEMIFHPYLEAIAEGIIPNHFALNKFGYNKDVGTTQEVIWSRGTTPYPYPNTARVCSVYSSSAMDSSGALGTGAKTVTLYGLDGNYNQINETISLLGLTKVKTTNLFLRMNRMIVRSAGSNLSNVGTISVKSGAGDSVMCEIAVGENQTFLALWTVPADKDAYITHFWASATGTKDTYVRLMVRPFGEVFQPKTVITLNNSYISHNFEMPLIIHEKSDIEMRTTATASGAIVTAGFDLWYEEEE